MISTLSSQGQVPPPAPAVTPRNSAPYNKDPRHIPQGSQIHRRAITYGHHQEDCFETASFVTRQPTMT
jgi:hypothetical protein